MDQTVLSSIDLRAKLEGVEVLCVYGIDLKVYAELKQWLKAEERRFLLFIEEEEEAFLKAKELNFAADPKVRLFYYPKAGEEIYQRISWEFV